ncbi:MAG TPA: hypothetical protein PKJ28_09205, partial [Bacteroidales bacterium]|nr:hypothetical protein [Bacteroidales bacterium]
MRDSRKFFLSLTLFLAPVILALGCLEYALRQQKNYLDIKKEKFEQVAGAVEVLILGDSHAHMGLDPARFDRKTFNLASPAQSYYYDVSLLLKYLPRMHN